MVTAFPIFLLKWKFGTKRLSGFLWDILKKDKLNSNLNKTVFNNLCCKKDIGIKTKFFRLSLETFFYFQLSPDPFRPLRPFTTRESMHDYQLQTWYTRAASRVAERLKTQDLRKLRNIKKISKLHRMIAQCPIFQPNEMFVNTSKKLFKNRN